MKGMFKAKNVSDHYWIYGYVVEVGGRVSILHEAFENQFEFVQVLPNTVCVNSGIMDVSGINIYSGDLLNINGDNVIVKYDKGCFYVTYGVKDYLLKDLLRDGDMEYPVVGNIYDLI